jgi:hypothetical protein
MKVPSLTVTSYIQTIIDKSLEISDNLDEFQGFPMEI